jgi:tRNA A37 methylthiotransferase MiaB
MPKKNPQSSIRNPKSFYLLSLGCSKNTVDSEGMAQLLGGVGYNSVADPGKAGVLIVNTCGFIGPAKEESVHALRELADAKKPGQMLIAAGCLSQRYGAELAKQVPGLDGILGTRRWMDIVDLVQRLRKGRDANRRSGRKCISQNCRWLPQAVRFLCYPAHQRHSRQPTGREHPRRSKAT